jgi:valyl-tRNA synthetase
VLALVLDHLLRILHPFVPFVTEALWERLNELAPFRGLERPIGISKLLVRAEWPSQRPEWKDAKLEEEFDLLREVIRAIRNVRSKYNVPPKNRLPVLIKASGPSAEVLRRLAGHIQSQGLVEPIEIAESPRPAQNAAKTAVGEIEIALEGVLDPDKERTRLEAKKAKLMKGIQVSEKKLSDEKFVNQAPPQVVQTERDRLAEARAELDALDKSLQDLA